jgi:peptidoglycan biosynthesis protein MviN/MurJ (putative lipid II flippase)
MGRRIGSVVAGYATMFAGVFVLMTLFWTLLGANGAFRPGSWDVTGTWIGLLLAAGIVAAVAGGYVAAAVAQDVQAGTWLAGLVFVLGIAMAIPVLTAGAPADLGPRPDQLPMFEAMGKGQQPAWSALLNPFIGALGSILGARLRHA